MCSPSSRSSSRERETALHILGVPKCTNMLQTEPTQFTSQTLFRSARSFSQLCRRFFRRCLRPLSEDGSSLCRPSLWPCLSVHEHCLQFRSSYSGSSVFSLSSNRAWFKNRN